MEDKVNFTFEIEKMKVERTNVLGSDVELKKFKYEDSNDNPYRNCPVFEYESKFKVLWIEEFKKAINILNKLKNDTGISKVRFILDNKILIIKFEGILSNFEYKIPGDDDYKGEVLLNSEYLKEILDSLDLKEIESIEIYIKENYPCGWEILNKNGSKNKILLAPCVED